VNSGLSVEKTSPSEGEVSIYDFIGTDYSEDGTTARSFRAKLKRLGKVDRIKLRVNSLGGDIAQGFAIYNMLLDHPAKVTAYIDGVAASMAGVIAMAADEVIMPENAWLMIHNPWSFAIGDSDDLRREADLLDSFKQAAMRAYVRHTSLSEKELGRLMDEETWFDAEAAVEAGFASRVSGRIVAAASAMKEEYLKRFSHAPAAIRDAGTGDPSPERLEESVMEKASDVQAAAAGEVACEFAAASEAVLVATTGEKSMAEMADVNVKRELDRKAAEVAEGQRQLRVDRAKYDVERLLGELGSKVTPAGLKGIGALLVRLKADPMLVECDGQELDAASVLLSAMRSMPDLPILSGEMAAEDQASEPSVVDRRFAAARARDAAAGIDDTRALALQKKYGIDYQLGDE
jgi:ATP-dependent protease ClpP protease subunit